MKMIWAQDVNGAIGKEGDIPWSCPADMAMFRHATKGFPVVMGRKTWESLPNAPLAFRQNIVASSNPRFSARGALTVRGVDALPENAFIIGGSHLYAELIDRVDELYVTIVDCAVEGADAFAPEIPDDMECVEVQELPTAEGEVSATFYRYARS